MNSDIKIIEYVRKLSKQDLEIEINGVKKTYKAKKKITITENFFLKDRCDMCGACCKEFGNAFFETEYKDLTIEELKNSLIKLPIKINGDEKFIYYSKPLPKSKLRIMHVHGRTIGACRYCFEKDGFNLCKIHKERSFTCKFPHIKIYEGNESSSITIGEYGRNWALKCPVTFKDAPLCSKEDLQNRINLFKDFYEKSKYLGIDTWLPEIISELEKIDEVTRRTIVIEE